MIESIYQKVLDWARDEDMVRAIIIEGSRGRLNAPIDRFSDYDLNLYVTDARAMFHNSSWISEFHPVWAMEKNLEPDGISTCLTIFEGGHDIDFKLIPVALLRSFTELEILPDEYHRGYQVVLDKDGLSARLPEPDHKAVMKDKPSQEEFTYAINVFWFEMFQLVKYLHREDLWHVKVRDTGLKNRLLQMMEWNAQANNDWEYDTWMAGKHLRDWIDPTIWENLFSIHAKFDVADSWRAAKAFIDLYRKLANQTAVLLSYQYPDNVDRPISNFIMSNPPI